MKDTASFEAANTVRRVARQIAENFVVVLAESRSLQIQMARKLREPEWEAWYFELAEKVIFNRANDLALTQMRMLHRLFHR